MKAIVYHKYGSADELELVEMEQPIPSDDEVLIEVCAVSINDWDLGLLTGEVFVNRLLNGLWKPRRKILGSDIAGRIVRVGNNVHQFQVGDEVYGDLSGSWGGFAEYVCAKANMLIKKPSGMSFEQAAAIPQAALLAHQALLKAGEIQSGHRVLVNGAGGGVGTFAVQIAKSSGVEFSGVDTSEKFAMMQSMGYDHVIDYQKEDFTRAGRQYDLILDVKTDRSVFDYMRVLKPGGTYVSVGGSMNRIIQALLLGPWIAIFNKKNIRLVGLQQNKGLAYINELFEAGKLMPLMDEPYTLAQVPEAIRYFEQGKHIGKVIIMINK